MTTLCPLCQEPCHDGLACSACCSRMAHILKDLPVLWVELQTTLIGMARIDKNGRSKGRETPLAFNLNASEVHDVVTATISIWIQDIADEQTGFDDLGSSMAAWCSWLLGRMPVIRRHLEIEYFVDELMHSYLLVKRAVDRPAELAYVCACQICGSGVYGPAEATDDLWVTCKECRRVAVRDEVSNEIVGFVPEYQVGAERLRRLAALRDACVVEHDIVVALRALRDEDYDRRTVWGWIHNYEIGVSLRRAVLPPSACRVEDRVLLYRVEDALRLAAMVPARRVGRNRGGAAVTLARIAEMR